MMYEVEPGAGGACPAARERGGGRQEGPLALWSTRPYTRLCWGVVVESREGGVGSSQGRLLNQILRAGVCVQWSLAPVGVSFCGEVASRCLLKVATSLSHFSPITESRVSPMTESHFSPTTESQFIGPFESSYWPIMSPFH